MKKYILASIMMLASTQARAEQVAEWGFLEEDEPRAEVPAKQIARSAHIEVAPTKTAFGPPDENEKPIERVKPQPANIVAAQASDEEETVKTQGCNPPNSNSDKTSSPVKVYVDQQKQTIKIDSPDREVPWESKVSTGGGLKIPNGRIKKAPYCARTPSINNRLIRAVREEDFRGSGCSSEQIRAQATVFKMYHTATFTDKSGRPVPMPHAIRIGGGIFFHEVPPSYSKLLGQNVSGECVRLSPNTARFLREQIEKYGAIEVTITEPPEVDRSMPQYCDQHMVAMARSGYDDYGHGSGAPVQATGSEGVYGGVESFTNILSRGIGGLVNGLTRPFTGGQ